MRAATQLVRDEVNFASNVLHFLRTAPNETLSYKGWQGLAERWERWFVDEIKSSRTDPSPEPSPR